MKLCRVKTDKADAKMIAIDSQITTNELAEICGITPRAIHKNINKLKKQGKLKRIGPDYGGHWEIINDV